jgi:hypothetical protein
VSGATSLALARASLKLLSFLVTNLLKNFPMPSPLWKPGTTPQPPTTHPSRADQKALAVAPFHSGLSGHVIKSTGQTTTLKELTSSYLLARFADRWLRFELTMYEDKGLVRLSAVEYYPLASTVRPATSLIPDLLLWLRKLQMTRWWESCSARARKGLLMLAPPEFITGA